MWIYTDCIESKAFEITHSHKTDPGDKSYAPAFICNFDEAYERLCCMCKGYSACWVTKFEQLVITVLIELLLSPTWISVFKHWVQSFIFDLIQTFSQFHYYFRQIFHQTPINPKSLVFECSGFNMHFNCHYVLEKMLICTLILCNWLCIIIIKLYVYISA